MATLWALVIAHLLVLLPLLQASVEFELHGNVYPDGYFYVVMNVGEPAKPYFLDVDTGSPVTWLECDFPCQSPKHGPNDMYKPGPSNMVSCEDDRCVTVHKDLRAVHDCSKNPDRCDYKVGYVEESSTGVLLADKFSLPTSIETRPNLAFGWPRSGDPVGRCPRHLRGTGDFTSQLKQQGIITENVVGHCISIHGGGFLFFGGDSNMVPTSGITWLPMAQRIGTYYTPGEATLNLNVQQEYPVSMKPMRTIFDSGTTYTYVHMTTYARLINAVGITLQSSTLKRVYDTALPVCWKDIEPIRSIDDVKNKFQPLDLTFGHGDKQVTLEIPPENYIIVSESGNVCLGILNGSEKGLQEQNLIGGIAMQNHIVIYDNESKQIGWVRSSCDGMPGHAPLIGSRL
ncbi:hypothetical protein QYE76_064336 [Lolium multiflorum]|uniref:Peptidase A1 domain-containing protein n=1 Tax=Lolium multiflorum TaxID=4521 RepID=A0AAD8W7I9_LOLMU|nr:hypothetical protein QYE76_064336 [Lolium multiflorum]